MNEDNTSYTEFAYVWQKPMVVFMMNASFKEQFLPDSREAAFSQPPSVSYQLWLEHANVDFVCFMVYVSRYGSLPSWACC